MLAVMQDCAVLLEGCCHLDDPDQLVTQFKEEMYRYIKELVRILYEL